MLISCSLIIFSSAQELYVKDPSSHDAAERYQTNISHATAAFLTLAQDERTGEILQATQHDYSSQYCVSQIQELEKEKLPLVRH